MKKALLPFNIALLIPDRNMLSRLGRVTSHEIFVGSGGNFHEEGLFSVSIFGRPGSHERESNFGYIKLGLPVIHPLVYRNILKLKGFYEEILLGRAYAVFDEETKDFVKASELDGQTGYTFFFDNWKRIEFKATDSDIRRVRLKLVNENRDKSTMDAMLVIPAGYRDAEPNPDGRIEYDEINDIYRVLLQQSTGIPEHFGQGADLSMYDRRRVAMQLKVQEIYDHYEKLISGKSGYVQAKWASRRVFNGTRNVISSMDTNAADLGEPNRPKFKDCVIGLHQASRGAAPKTIYGMRTSVIGDIFDTMSNRVELVNKKTLVREWVDVTVDDMDTWSTPQGLERVMNELEVIEKRSRAIEIADHYLALVYLDDKKNYRIIRDINEIPPGFDQKWARPITYAELIYLSGLNMWYKLRGFVTRYPVENYNSSIPVSIYVKTTVTGELRYPLNADFQRDTEGPTALEYPMLEVGKVAQWHDSTSVSPSILAPLGADFDGDTVSVNIVYGKESIEEMDNFFRSRIAYMNATGGLAFSSTIHTVNLVLRYMTGDPKPRT
ncbi:hypothetical protein D3C87_823410 [compost metagenome]